LIVGPIKGIEKPMRVSRPSSDMLVLTRTRFGALIRLLIWLAIVAGFYWVLLTEQPQSLVQAQPARWLLVLVPLFLLPYLVDIVRVLVRGESHVFDAGVGELRAAQHAPVPFAQIQCLELRAVNGGCEELTLSARLLDGRSIALLTDDASSRFVTLAAEAANLAGVELTRR
jgi:hypothetical protein